MSNYEISDFIWGVVYEHTSNRYPREWSSYFNTVPMLIAALVLSKFTCQKSLQTTNYSSMGEMYCNIK